MLDIREDSDHVTIKIKAKTKASESAILGVRGDALLVAVTAAPEKGKANKAIVDLLAKQLKLAKQNLEIISGQTNVQKVLSIKGIRSNELLLLLKLDNLSR